MRFCLHAIRSGKMMIIICSVALGIGVGFIALFVYQKVGFAPKNEQLSDEQSALFIHSAEYSGITIASDLPPVTLQEIADFMTASVRKELLPSRMTLEKMSKSAAGENEYAGRWSAHDYEFNVLSVVDEKGTSQYLRVWVLIPEQKINADIAIFLLREIYKEAAIKEVGLVHCANASGKSGQNQATVCERMITDGSGKKIGMLVRSPLRIGQNAKLTIVSFCAVPKESNKYAITDFCI